MKRIILLTLVLALATAGLPSRCRAAEDDSATQATLALLGVVAVVFLVTAWQSDFGEDEMRVDDASGLQLVACHPASASAENELAAGLAVRSLF